MARLCGARGGRLTRNELVLTQEGEGVNVEQKGLKEEEDTFLWQPALLLLRLSWLNATSACNLALGESMPHRNGRPARTRAWLRSTFAAAAVLLGLVTPAAAQQNCNTPLGWWESKGLVPFFLN